MGRKKEPNSKAQTAERDRAHLVAEIAKNPGKRADQYSAHPNRLKKLEREGHVISKIQDGVRRWYLAPK